MSSVMHTVLSTELTNIPNSMELILGENFNNTLCNGITWLFVIWTIFHFCYDKLLNAYLKQLGFLQYQRARLSNSLWLLAIFAAFFAYYVLTLDGFDMGMFNFKRTFTGENENVPTDKALAYAIVCSYYLHMAFKQGLQLGSLCSFATFIALIVACTSAYILRVLEIPFTLTALIAVSGVFEELSKLSYSLLHRGNRCCNLIINFLYVSSIAVFCMVYVAIIPLSFLIPLGIKLFAGKASLLLITLFTSLMCWLNLVLYKSVLLNLIFHWFYHSRHASEKEEDEDDKWVNKLNCLGRTIGCSLYPPRTDDGFMLAYLRAETKQRLRRTLGRRSPKNRAMLIQTLKCMMALKKKLSEKKAELEDAKGSGEKHAEEDSFIDEEEDDEDEDGIDESEKQHTSAIKKSAKITRLSDEVTQIGSEAPDNGDDNDEVEIEIKNVDAQEDKATDTCRDVSSTASQAESNVKEVMNIETSKESSTKNEPVRATPSLGPNQDSCSANEIKNTPVSVIDNTTEYVKAESNKNNELINISQTTNEDCQAPCSSTTLLLQNVNKGTVGDSTENNKTDLKNPEMCI